MNKKIFTLIVALFAVTFSAGAVSIEKAVEEGDYYRIALGADLSYLAITENKAGVEDSIQLVEKDKADFWKITKGTEPVSGEVIYSFTNKAGKKMAMQTTFEEGETPAATATGISSFLLGGTEAGGYIFSVVVDQVPYYWNGETAVGNFAYVANGASSFSIHEVVSEVVTDPKTISPFSPFSFIPVVSGIEELPLNADVVIRAVDVDDSGEYFRLESVENPGTYLTAGSAFNIDLNNKEEGSTFGSTLSFEEEREYNKAFQRFRMHRNPVNGVYYLEVKKAPVFGAEADEYGEFASEDVVRDVALVYYEVLGKKVFVAGNGTFDEYLNEIDGLLGKPLGFTVKNGEPVKIESGVYFLKDFNYESMPTYGKYVDGFRNTITPSVLNPESQWYVVVKEDGSTAIASRGKMGIPLTGTDWDNDAGEYVPLFVELFAVEGEENQYSFEMDDETYTFEFEKADVDPADKFLGMANMDPNTLANNAFSLKVQSPLTGMQNVYVYDKDGNKLGADNMDQDEATRFRFEPVYYINTEASIEIGEMPVSIPYDMVFGMFPLPEILTDFIKGLIPVPNNILGYNLLNIQPYGYNGGATILGDTLYRRDYYVTDRFSSKVLSYAYLENQDEPWKGKYLPEVSFEYGMLAKNTFDDGITLNTNVLDITAMINCLYNKFIGLVPNKDNETVEMVSHYPVPVTFMEEFVSTNNNFFSDIDDVEFEMVANFINYEAIPPIGGPRMDYEYEGNSEIPSIYYNERIALNAGTGYLEFVEEGYEGAMMGKFKLIQSDAPKFAAFDEGHYTVSTTNPNWGKMGVTYDPATTIAEMALPSETGFAEELFGLYIQPAKAAVAVEETEEPELEADEAEIVIEREVRPTYYISTGSTNITPEENEMGISNYLSFPSDKVFNLSKLQPLLENVEDYMIENFGKDEDWNGNLVDWMMEELFSFLVNDINPDSEFIEKGTVGFPFIKAAFFKGQITEDGLAVLGEDNEIVSTYKTGMLNPAVMAMPYVSEDYVNIETRYGIDLKLDVKKLLESDNEELVEEVEDYIEMVEGFVNDNPLPPGTLQPIVIGDELQLTIYLPFYLRMLNESLVWTFTPVDAYNFNIAQTNLFPSSNEAPEVSDVKVSGGQGCVVVKGAEGKNVSICDVLGKTIITTKIASDEATYNAPAGVVIVTVDGEASVKALVK